MTVDQLIADIRATFPGVKAMRRDSGFGSNAWMIGAEQSAIFPDGLPVLCDCAGCFESGTHDGGVHLGFAAWLESRGYYLERYDEFWHRPTAIPTPEEIANWQAKAAIAVASCGDVIDDGCPF